MAEKGTNGVISWNRFGYKWNGEGPFQRVTTIKAKKGSGNALIDWAAGCVAAKAKLIGEDLRDGRLDRDSAIASLLDEGLAQAHNQVRDAAADFGTIFHGLVENLAAGDQDALHVAEAEIERAAFAAYVDRQGIELKNEQAERLFRQRLSQEERDALALEAETTKGRLWPDVEAFLDWVDTEKPEWLRNEFQVFNRRYNYAGSVDVDMKLGGRRFIADVKTSRGIYKDYALQLAAYTHAEFVGEADGRETAVPAFEGGLILHIRDGRVNVLHIGVDSLEQAWQGFLACKQIYDFDRYAADFAPYQPKPKLELLEVFA